MGSVGSRRRKEVYMFDHDLELTQQERERVIRGRQLHLVTVATQTEDQCCQSLFSVTTQTEDQHLKGLGDSQNRDYQSDGDEEESLINDIDPDYLCKFYLETLEGVGSDDEEDETDSAYLPSSDSMEDLFEVNENGSAVPPRFQPNFAEFPSHKTLKQENQRYWLWRDQYSIETSDINIPRDCKADIFDAEEFAALDKYAIEAPKELLNEPVKEVVNYLIKNCLTELQKTRVLFRWCVAQNLIKLPDKSEANSILQRLKAIHDNRESYGNLYSHMLSLSNVENKLLYGTLKVALEPDDKGAGSTNEWTAVRIDNIWRLVDLHCASRHQTGGSHGEWELIDDNGQGYTEVDDALTGLSYMINEFYFLTNPEDFVYDHYPDNNQWQLLSRTVSKEEFKDMAYLRPSFFTLDMDARAARRCVLHAQSGEVIIKLGLPKHKQRKFMYQLWKSSKDGVLTDSFKDKKLTQFAFMEQHREILMCKVSFPLTGKYKFRIFGKDSENSENNFYSCIADYLIYCTKEKEDFFALPTNKRQEWGPGHDISNLGMRPISHTEGVIETEDGHVEIKFEAQHSVEILANLRGKNEENLDQWVMHRTENGKAVINLRIQKKETYALDIFAKLQSQEGSLPLVCTYLVNAADGVMDKLEFPIKRAGAAEQGREYNLVPVSHKDSYFKSAKGKENIILEYSTPLEFTTGLSLQSTEGVTKIQNHIFHQQTRNRVIFKSRFPKVGIYQLNIFAKPKGQEGGYTHVYTYVIIVTNPMVRCIPFPKILSTWGEGLEIEGFEDGFVGSGEEIEVKMKIPKAQQVVLKEGSVITYLKETQDESWTAKVTVGNSSQNIILAASYGDNPSSFTALAEYEVKTKKELDAIKKEQNEKLKKEEDRKKKEEEMKKNKKAEFTGIKKELKGSIKSNDIKRLRKAVQKVEDNAYTHRLKEDYNTSKNLIISSERIEKRKRTVLKMKPATMEEMKSISQPSNLVHLCMIATMLLLGETETITKEWKKCQSLGNSNVLKEKVHNFNIHDLHPEIASRSKNILGKFRLEDVLEISLGAACLYAWTVGMCEELNILKRNSVKKAKPANIMRQNEIFSKKANRDSQI